VARADANVEWLAQLHTTLAVNNMALGNLPMVLQYNKRDLADVSSVAELDELLNESGYVRFETIACQGVGVFETLHALVDQVVAAAGGS